MAVNDHSPSIALYPVDVSDFTRIRIVDGHSRGGAFNLCGHWKWTEFTSLRKSSLIMEIMMNWAYTLSQNYILTCSLSVWLGGRVLVCRWNGCTSFPLCYCRLWNKNQGSRCQDIPPGNFPFIHLQTHLRVHAFIVSCLKWLEWMVYYYHWSKVGSLAESLGALLGVEN